MPIDDENINFKLTARNLRLSLSHRVCFKSPLSHSKLDLPLKLK
jgi:hypothetical protein